MTPRVYGKQHESTKKSFTRLKWNNNGLFPQYIFFSFFIWIVALQWTVWLRSIAFWHLQTSATLNPFIIIWNVWRLDLAGLVQFPLWVLTNALHSPVVNGKSAGLVKSPLKIFDWMLEPLPIANNVQKSKLLTISPFRLKQRNLRFVRL